MQVSNLMTSIIFFTIYHIVLTPLNRGKKGIRLKTCVSGDTGSGSGAIKFHDRVCVLLLEFLGTGEGECILGEEG